MLPHFIAGVNSLGSLNAVVDNLNLLLTKRPDPPPTAAASGLKPVQVRMVAGDPGSATTTCSYSYDVFTLDGSAKIGANLTPLKGRSVMRMLAPVAPQTGLAFYDAGGGLLLWDANEVMDTAGDTTDAV